KLQPILVVAFNQRIDPAAVLRSIRLRAGGADRAVRLVTPAELAADSDAVALTRGQEPGRWLAFRPVAPLPRNTSVRVSVGPGTPSREGPRLTEYEQFWEFRTYGPLAVENQYCSCDPGEPIRITFTNPLDVRAFGESMVRVTPAIAGMHAFASGGTLSIWGATLRSTRYTITLDPALRDVFGQTLGPARPLVVEVGE